MDLLFKKLFGCEAAGAIGNSMGEIMEGLTYKESREKYGIVDTLLPVDKTGHETPTDIGPRIIYYPHHREPGCTEDGQERHRLCASAIIKKGGRIDIMDLAKTWAEDIRPENFGYLLGPQDQIIYYSIKAGIPPWEVGRYAAWPAFIGTAKMIVPVGEVNACYPEMAAQDAFELGRIKDVRGVPNNYSLEVCAGIAAAVAEALKPTATVNSIIDTALSYLSERPLKEVQLGLHWAKNVDNWQELGPLYEEKYKGHPISNAVEILSGALACFLLADGQPRESIIYSVNIGRDTDCKAHNAGAFAGALRGIDAVPADWVKTIEEEVVNNPWTVSRKTTKETAEGIYKAAINNMNRMKKAISDIDQLTKSL